MRKLKGKSINDNPPFDYYLLRYNLPLIIIYFRHGALIHFNQKEYEFDLCRNKLPRINYCDLQTVICEFFQKIRLIKTEF
jgi:hypothetical protein